MNSETASLIATRYWECGSFKWHDQYNAFLQ